MMKILWVFPSSLRAKEWLNKKKISPMVWDRVLILWDEQTTHERQWEERKNINGIFIAWPRWEPWKDWRDWRDGKHGRDWKDWEKWETWEQWPQWPRWYTWEQWPMPDIHEVVDLLAKKILSNSDMIQKITWPKGKDGKDWRDGIDGRDGRDGVDGVDGKRWLDGIDWSMIHVVDIFDNEWRWDEKDIVIDYEKNIYFYRNNSIVKI